MLNRLSVLFLCTGLMLLLVNGWNQSYAELKPFQAPRPIVVELFTSQGCSSCPPADRLLGQIANNEYILPLSFHVDYWNYIGWKDPFSNKKFTQRQTIYNQIFKNRSNYTPQAIVDGKLAFVGSNRAKLFGAINQIAQDMITVPIGFNMDTNNNYKITIDSGVYGPADIFIIGYDVKRNTVISRGENVGRNVTNFNVVKYFEYLGKWHGKSQTITYKPWKKEPPEHVAIILQRSSDAVIIGAAKMHY